MKFVNEIIERRRSNMSSNNKNTNNGIFINQITENQPELQQPSIKRQRIDGNEEQHPSKSTHTPPVPKSLAFLDDSGNSTSSSSSPPSPVNESENILKSDFDHTIDTKDEGQSDEECLTTFQLQLTQRQCLCGISERILKIPFQYYSVKKLVGKKQTFNRTENDASDSKKSDAQVHYIKSLKHWPEEHLIKFLSSIQLLFTVYLKQNAKGNICGKIMDLCDCLIRNEIHIFDELIELCNSISNNSNFVSYISSKVITSFLIIIKDEIDQKWLKKIVDNLFSFDHLDYVAVKRINFSLDIIKCIVEWKDYDEHVLEEEHGNHHPQPPLPPPLETNYFATFYNDQSGPSTSSGSSALPSYLTSQATINSGRSSATSGHNSPVSNGCHFVQLTDSESFDTAHIKLITTRILGNKWPALVNNICTLITQVSAANSRGSTNRTSASLTNAENCIMTFIALWQSIIDVKTNLSVMETLPFTAPLANFESRLNKNLPCTIYKKMLELFNEALCYGTTLSLQDMLPSETCALATKIIRHVKDNRCPLLESLPRQINLTNQSDDDLKTLIGLNCETVVISPDSLERQRTTTSIATTDISTTFNKSSLQLLTLLVLKSAAVSMKEFRADSSDSSMDSYDSDALQDLKTIEFSIRLVLKKLETFIKESNNFHPDSHFSKVMTHLFEDQDDFLIEAMLCTLDLTVGFSPRNDPFPELVKMLNPVYTFLEFLKICSNDASLLLDFLMSSETCFLCYIKRFLKYVRMNWTLFKRSCEDCGIGNNMLEDTMTVMIRLRYKIARLVTNGVFPYEFGPILKLLEFCENLYEDNEFS